MELLLVLLVAGCGGEPRPYGDRRSVVRHPFRVQITPAGSLGVDPPGGDPGEPYAALVKKCTVGAAAPLKAGGSATNGNLKIALGTDGTLTLMNVDKKATLFSARASTR